MRDRGLESAVPRDSSMAIGSMRRKGLLGEGSVEQSPSLGVGEEQKTGRRAVLYCVELESEENSFCLSLTGRWCPHPQTTVRREEAEPPKPGSHGLFSAWVGGEAGTGTLGVPLPLTSESAPSGGPRSLPSLTASPTHCSPLVSPRVSGLSPFMGDNDNETLANVTSATWDFDDEAFDEISDDAKDFISNLLKKDMK